MSELKMELGDFKPTILLVDDNEDILEYLCNDLKTIYTVFTAQNASEALALLESKFIQLIVSDVMMPGMDGFEFCEKIKEGVEYSHIPLILLTAKDTLNSKIQGLKTGADAYIEKPFSIEYLHVQIENLLQGRARLRNFFSKSPLTYIDQAEYSKIDMQFLRDLDRAIRENVEDDELDVDKLGTLMNMSRSTLYRKIKSISGMNPYDIINIVRVKIAAELIHEGNSRINEISMLVGYKSTRQLRMNFIRHYNLSPSEYIEKVLHNTGKA